MKLYVVKRTDNYCYDPVTDDWCVDTAIMAIFQDPKKADECKTRYAMNALDLGFRVLRETETSITITANDTGEPSSYTTYYVEETEVETDLE
jgi:hypothetical protein